MDGYAHIETMRRNVILAKKSQKQHCKTYYSMPTVLFASLIFHTSRIMIRWHNIYTHEPNPDTVIEEHNPSSHGSCTEEYDANLDGKRRRYVVVV
jgi:hypothetical protein